MPVQPEHEPAEGSSTSWAGRHPAAGQALEDLGSGWALFTRQGWTGQRMAAIVAAVVINFLALLVTINLIPGLSATAEWDVVLAVVLAAILTAALRPALQALALAFGWLGVLVVGLFARAVILYVAFVVTPDIHVDGFWPAFAASWLAAVITIAISWLLSAGDETEFLSQLLMFSRPRRVPRQHEPGVVMLQIDGLAAPLLQWAVASGNLPTLSRWIRAGSHRLTPWQAQVPPTTPASQAGLLHGNNRGVPAFRWFEKDAGRLVVASKPKDAALIESRMSDGRGLLADDGVSISNIFSGDAPVSHLTLSGLALGGRPARSYAAFFISPYGFTRSFMLTVGEALKEMYQARRQRLRGIEPRIRRSRVFAAQRAISNVLLRDLNTVLVAQHIMRGAKSIFCDYTDYDEIAHHAGPTRAESLRALEGVDRVIGTLAALAAHAPRPYEFVILSDHGQSQGATFRQRYGTPLEEVIRGLMAGTGGPTPRSIAATGTEEARTPVSRFLAELRQRHGMVGLLSRSKLAAVVEEEPRTAGAEAGRAEAGRAEAARRPDAPAGVARHDGPELVVAAGGNLALVYFPRHEGRLTAEQIETAYPGLLAGIASHPGIGFVCVRTNNDGPVVLGRAGVHQLGSGVVSGSDPLAAFGPRAARDLLDHDTCDHVGDLVINSCLDAGTDEVAAFEELVGCHGGLGGWQDRAVLVHPADWPVDEELIGAEAVHRQLVRWLRSAGHRKDLAALAPRTVTSAKA
jgi:uncharacterized membrane protein YvlD (DUF360 family)